MATITPIREPERPRSHAHAAQTLGDTPFLAYALVQAFKFFIAIVSKRWPHIT